MHKSVILATLLFSPLFIGCSQSPPKFNPSDMHETARWAGETLKPPNSIPIENEIARNDALRSEMAGIKAKFTLLVGQAVAWDVDCGVSETVVTLLPNRFNEEGKGVSSVAPDKIVMMLLNDRPKSGRDAISNQDDPPHLRYFQIRVPEKISRTDAAKLTDRVTMNAKIKEFEIGKYEDNMFNEQFVLYVYLTDIVLSPVVK